MQETSIQKLSDLNFQALDRLKTENLGKNEVILLILPFIGIAVLLFIALTTENEKLLNLGITVLLFWVGLGVLFLVFKAFKAFIISIKSPNYLAKFAIENNLIYAKKDSESVEQKPGTIFHIDRSNSKGIQNLLKGKTMDYNFSCFKYSYSIGSGENARNYDAAVVEIELPQEVPHLVIDSLMESVNLDIRSSVLPIQFSENQRINLEGSFSRYFAVYSTDKQEVNTLSLLSPDVMEIIMHFGSKCDIEMVKNRLYFYWPDIPQTRGDYEKMFQTVDSLWGKIGRKLSRKDLITQSVNIPLVHTIQSDSSQLKPKYSPLSKKTFRAGFVALVLVGFVLLQIFPYLNIGSGSLLGLGILEFSILAVIFIVVAFLSYKLYRQKKLLQELDQDNRN